MDEHVEKYLQEVIRKELEWDINDTKFHIRRLALEEVYYRVFGEVYEYRVFNEL